MGTHSLTYVHDTAWGDEEDPLDTDPVVCIYQQYDGYFDGVGKDIVNFLAGSEMVNGIGVSDHPVFNGAGDLAARLITQFKGGDADNAGGVYIEPPDRPDDEGYIYRIYCPHGEEPYIKASAWGRMVEGPASKIDLSDPDDDV